MTKTTSYEISKKLKEAGFEAEADYYWVESKVESICVSIHVFSDYMTGGKKLYARYDLETLINALPTFIANKNKGENCLVIDVAFGEIYYEGDSDNDAMFITTMEENESLADTAGRMWLMLKEKGIV